MGMVFQRQGCSKSPPPDLLSKHGVNGSLHFDWIRYVDTVSVHPEVIKPVMLRLLCVELEFLIANLILADPVHHISVDNLVAIRPHVCDRIA